MPSNHLSLDIAPRDIQTILQKYWSVFLKYFNGIDALEKSLFARISSGNWCGRCLRALDSSRPKPELSLKNESLRVTLDALDTPHNVDLAASTLTDAPVSRPGTPGNTCSTQKHRDIHAALTEITGLFHLSPMTIQCTSSRTYSALPWSFTRHQILSWPAKFPLAKVHAHSV